MSSAAILPASFAIPRSSNRSLSSCWAFNGPYLFRPFSIATSLLTAASDLSSVATIRMGGGPRTYPGGVSKWQWKRMQAKKSKQLLKARLCRERQLYEMRKRAELKAAISELERPWDVVERAPVLFSVSADEQIKALADRFQRPSGFDMWSERDGPRLFHSAVDLPSARFIPKGAIHSVKPYGVVAGDLTNGREEEKVMRNDDWIARGPGGMGRRRHTAVLPDSSSLESERSVSVGEDNGDAGRNRRFYKLDSELVVASSRKAENDMASRFSRYGKNHGSHGLDSDIVVNGSRMNGHDMVGYFGSRGGRDRNWDSRRSDSELADTGSRMERHGMAGRFTRRGGGGGRSRYQESNKSHSESAVKGSSMERNEMASDIGGRTGADRNLGSSESYTELAVAGSTMQRQEMAGGFDRRRGRGSRGGNGGFYRSYSKPEKEENDGGFGKRDDHGGRRKTITVAFDRRGGRRGHGGNRGFYQSYSELAIAGSRMVRGEIGGGFENRGGFDGSDSELDMADWRKGRVEMAGSHDRNYSYGGRVSLRPTTQLRLEEGRDVRRDLKWSGGRNDGFRVNRGRGSA